MPDRETLYIRAKQMRADATLAESALWDMLRARRLGNLKFRRQVPIGNYIADFACETPKLIVEADGSAHRNPEYDAARDAWLRRAGYLVLRFHNAEVLTKTHLVVARILDAVRLGREP